MEKLIWLLEHADILLGLILLLVACLILPRHVRWYVLTAGIALLAMQVWQAYRAREKMRVLDEQRKTLLQRLAGLEDTAEELKKNNEQLAANAAALERERQSLQQRLQQLQQRDRDIDAEKTDVEQQLQDQQQSIQDAREQIRRGLEAAARVQAIQSAVSNGGQ